MEKMMKFIDEVGPAGGAGAFLLLASWGLLVADLIDFKPDNLPGLPPAQLIASLAGTLGLSLLLYRLKQATKEKAQNVTTSAADQASWQRFASFIKDRRALMALVDYEHLPSMIASVDAIRDYLREELRTLSAGNRVRQDFELLQEACRDFASSCDKIWNDHQAMPSHLGEARPIDQWQFCTGAGVLRGRVAAMLRVHEIPNTKALIAGLLGHV
jgi:hypothetical protein